MPTLLMNFAIGLLVSFLGTLLGMGIYYIRKNSLPTTDQRPHSTVLSGFFS